MSFKQNVPYKSCTQKGTSIGDLEVVLNYLLFDFYLFHKRIIYYYVLLFIYWTYATKDHT